MNRLAASDNPLLQIAGLIVAVIVGVAAIFLGAVFLSLFMGLAIVAGIAMYIRIWWMRRKMGRKGGQSGGGPPGEIVGVEYTVVKERTVDQRDID